MRDTRDAKKWAANLRKHGYDFEDAAKAIQGSATVTRGQQQRRTTLDAILQSPRPIAGGAPLVRASRCRPAQRIQWTSLPHAACYRESCRTSRQAEESYGLEKSDWCATSIAVPPAPTSYRSTRAAPRSVVSFGCLSAASLDRHWRHKQLQTCLLRSLEACVRYCALFDSSQRTPSSGSGLLPEYRGIRRVFRGATVGRGAVPSLMPMLYPSGPNSCVLMSAVSGWLR